MTVDIPSTCRMMIEKVRDQEASRLETTQTLVARVDQNTEVCVIEWNAVTVSQSKPDERHAREILKGLELERANRSTTPCAVDRRDEGKGESRRGSAGQTQTEHE